MQDLGKTVRTIAVAARSLRRPWPIQAPPTVDRAVQEPALEPLQQPAQRKTANLGLWLGSGLRAVGVSAGGEIGAEIWSDRANSGRRRPMEAERLTGVGVLHEGVSAQLGLLFQVVARQLRI